MAEQTESSISIAAPPHAVMAVIADMAAYPQWNEEVKEVEVRTTHPDGRPAEVRFVLDAGAIKDEYVLAYRWSGDTSVSWTLVRASMLTAMEGTYLLAARGDGTTDVSYRLVVDVRIPMIGLIKRKAEKVIVDRALKGLKKRVEA
jgi:Polyketide cyclase / dehydrase and lipid transport